MASLKTMKKAAPGQIAGGRGAAVKFYSTLREGIVEGKYLPGERLVETDLSERHEINRNVVRAVLLRLESDGLVVREPNRGARVRVISIDEAREIVDIRVSLETLVAR